MVVNLGNIFAVEEIIIARNIVRKPSKLGIYEKNISRDGQGERRQTGEGWGYIKGQA